MIKVKSISLSIELSQMHHSSEPNESAKSIDLLTDFKFLLSIRNSTHRFQIKLKFETCIKQESGNKVAIKYSEMLYVDINVSMFKRLYNFAVIK